MLVIAPLLRKKVGARAYRRCVVCGISLAIIIRSSTLFLVGRRPLLLIHSVTGLICIYQA